MKSSAFLSGLRRKTQTRQYRPLYVVFTEGKSEAQYFSMIKLHVKPQIEIECIQGKHPDPNSLLRQICTYNKKSYIQGKYEMWVVLDKDSWSTEKLNLLFNPPRKAGVINVAISNPQFEYWLLLHFDKGLGIQAVRDCLTRLKQYDMHYKKGIINHSLYWNKVRDAIEYAKTKDNPPTKTWTSLAGTTVYHLVEKLIEFID